MTSLGEAQFGKYVMLKQQSGNDDDGSTTYNLWGENKSGKPWAIDHGKMTVWHNPGWSATTYPPHGGGPSPEHVARAAVFKEHGLAPPTDDSDWHARNADKVTGQVPLFKHGETPSHDEVHLMALSRESRHMAPTMLGMAQNASMARTGRDLRAPDDLSVHSERMVDKLKARGAVPESHTIENHNYMDFERAHVSDHFGLQGVVDSGGDAWGGEQHPIPRTEVEAGRKTMRHVLNNKQWTPRSETPAPGRGQGTLPGIS